MMDNVFCFGLGEPFINLRLTVWYELRLIDSSALDRLNSGHMLSAAYEKWGESVPEKLSGEFAVVIQDHDKDQVLFFVDHMGSRTLYYYQDANQLVIATAEHLLFSQGNIPRRPNLHCIASSISAGFGLSHP